MKRKFAHVVLMLAGLAIFVGAGYVALLVSLVDDPKGKYASCDFVPHDISDVLDFSRGLVTQRTCCGDSSIGTYEREPDGRWIWTYTEERWVGGPRWAVPRVGRYERTTKRYVLRRTLFFLHIESLDDPSYALDMRRRLFKKLPL